MSRLLKTFLVVAAGGMAVILYRGVPVTRKSVQPLSKPFPEARAISSVTPPPAPSDVHEAKVLAMALEKKPGHAPVLFKLARMESAQGHYLEAAGHLRQILQKEPENPEARLELGKALFQLGDVQGAIEQTQDILKTHPSYADALYNLGAIYGNLGNRERAMAYWQRLVVLDPKSDSGRKAREMMSQLQTSIP